MTVGLCPCHAGVIGLKVLADAAAPLAWRACESES